MCIVQGQSHRNHCNNYKKQDKILYSVAFIQRTLWDKKVCLLYRGVLYVEVILYSKECNWYTRCCPLNGGVCYRKSVKRGYNVIMYVMVIIIEYILRDVIAHSS